VIASLIVKTALRAPLLAIIGCAIALSAACGDGPDNPDATATRSAGLAAAATPDLGGNVVAVLPEHGAAVPRAQTTGASGQYGGICASLEFEGNVLPQWVHMMIDGEDQVTNELTWFVETLESPDDGRVCYQPDGGLDPGLHTVTILLINPQNLQAPPIERVDWTFEVTE